MNVFTFWYTYYDSLFTKIPFRSSNIIYQGFAKQITQSIPWPYDGQKTGIIECYKQLQNFINNPQNWKKSKCTSVELNNAQQKINNIYVLMQVEKQYILQFWKVSKRRIQSSICHFFIFFESVVKCLIPNENFTIKICIQQQVLCTDLKYLEILSNRVLQHIPKMYQFMIKKQFAKQKTLTDQFFSYFSGLIQNLCHIKKKSMGCKVLRLVKYISLSNPIEVSKKYIISQKLHETSPQKPRIVVQQARKTINSCKKFIDNLGNRLSIGKSSILNSKRYNKSAEYLQLLKNTAQQIYRIPQQPKMFQFSQMVRRHSFIYHQKKPTFSTSHQSSVRQRIQTSREQTQRQRQLMSATTPRKAKIMTMQQGKRPKASSIGKRDRKSKLQSSRSQRQQKKMSQVQINKILIKDQQMERGQIQQLEKGQRKLSAEKPSANVVLKIGKRRNQRIENILQKRAQNQIQNLLKDL